MINLDLSSIARAFPNHDIASVLASGLQITVFPFQESTSYFDANTGWWHLSKGAFIMTYGDHLVHTFLDTSVLDGTEGNIIGTVVRWNPHGLGECIVQYNDGSADSAIFSELHLYNRKAAKEYLDRLEP